MSHNLSPAEHINIEAVYASLTLHLTPVGQQASYIHPTPRPHNLYSRVGDTIRLLGPITSVRVVVLFDGCAIYHFSLFSFNEVLHYNISTERTRSLLHHINGSVP